MTVTDDNLLAAATEACGNAHAPYSGYTVGAAVLDEQGRIHVGCNVENAAYGVGLCAECGLVSRLHLEGGGRLTHFVCVGGPVGTEPVVVMPCGRCRQLLWENGGPEMEILTVSGLRRMSEVLPDAFGADDLA